MIMGEDDRNLLGLFVGVRKVFWVGNVPAVSQRPRAIGLPSTITFAE
jgi:hypothetical protein